jgi:hypothetical protein
MKSAVFQMPHSGISCQDDFTLLQIISQMDSFISYDSKCFKNGVMGEVELDDVKCDLLR